MDKAGHEEVGQFDKEAEIADFDDNGVEGFQIFFGDLAFKELEELEFSRFL